MNSRAYWLIVLAGISHDVALIEWPGAEDCLKVFFTQVPGVWEKLNSWKLEQVTLLCLSLFVLPCGLSNIEASG